jgi:tripartite-type tricarboxylate transporter receptor subunit TctC
MIDLSPRGASATFDVKAPTGIPVPYLPGFEVVGWYGVLAPTKLPKPIVTRLHDEFVKVLKQPDVNEKIVLTGAEAVGSAP